MRWVWIFAALDHFNSKVIGHSTNGSRFSALEPISQALTDRFGGKLARQLRRRAAGSISAW